MPHRILVVEDEMLQRFDLCNILREAGYEPLGPAPTVDRAIRILATSHCDAAILDVGLAGGSTSDGLVAHLADRGIPSVAVSGHLTVPPPFQSMPLLGKPINRDAFLRAIAALVCAATPPPPVPLEVKSPEAI